jgi:hypothetical protein
MRITLSEYGAKSRKASMRPLTRFAWLTLAYNIAVVLWGAYVRATGSGAGCGNRWPLCNGTVLPRTPQAQTIIEFTHRLTSALAVGMVSSLLLWCWRKTAKGDWARYSSLAAILLLFNEALLGALLVLFEHVGQDRSPGRVFFLCMHFGNTLLLLAALALTAQWLSKGYRRFSVVKKRAEIVAVAFGLLATTSIGISRRPWRHAVSCHFVEDIINTGFFFWKYPSTSPLSTPGGCCNRSHLCSMVNPEKLEDAGATVESRGDACWSSDWADWSGPPERDLAGSRMAADLASARC